MKQRKRIYFTDAQKQQIWDRSKELADHQWFKLATNAGGYFCDPHSSWQRGSNENPNRLLRQYFPKGIDISRHSQATKRASQKDP